MGQITFFWVSLVLASFLGNLAEFTQRLFPEHVRVSADYRLVAQKRSKRGTKGSSLLYLVEYIYAKLTHGALVKMTSFVC
jgi:hypothetical protein